METIIAYVPDSMVKGQLKEAANAVADGCAGILGREKGTIPVMIHKTGAADGNECGSQTIVFYVYAGVKCSREIREQTAEKIFQISQEYFPGMKKENHVVIFKLHEQEAMGVNGKFEE